MKTATVPKIFDRETRPGLKDVSRKLDLYGAQIDIDTINWPQFDYAPKVKTLLGYGNKELYLKYFVDDKYFVARNKETNQNIYEDSCVEFFVAPSDDGYYNFEINAIGACLMGFGPSKEDRERVNPEIVSKIRRLSSFGKKAQEEEIRDVQWNIVIAIPFGVFFNHQIKDLSGCQFKANFYKCGNRLSVPHYLSWNPITTEKPNFHKPENFGLLVFQ